MISIYIKLKNNKRAQFTKPLRDPYRLFDILRHTFPELALLLILF